MNAEKRQPLIFQGIVQDDPVARSLKYSLLLKSSNRDRVTPEEVSPDHTSKWLILIKSPTANQSIRTFL